MKKGTKVTARTVRSNIERDGKVAEVHPSNTGDWIEIKPDDGGKNFKTRRSLVTME